MPKAFNLGSSFSQASNKISTRFTLWFTKLNISSFPKLLPLQKSSRQNRRIIFILSHPCVDISYATHVTLTRLTHLPLQAQDGRQGKVRKSWNNDEYYAGFDSS